VSLLTKLPNAHVIAFEADQKTQNQLVEMATINGVRDRIDIHGFGDKAALKQAFRDAGNFSRNIPWLIVDIEGGEKELLNPADVPSLKNCPILVELHDCLVPGCYETIKKRFEKTHEIKEIQSQVRTLDDVPLSLPIPGWKLKRVIRERGHHPMIWLWMQPFNRGSQA